MNEEVFGMSFEVLEVEVIVFDIESLEDLSCKVRCGEFEVSRLKSNGVESVGPFYVELALEIATACE